MCEPTIVCTTRVYRESSVQLINAMKDPTSTVQQIDNGFKCLSIMYFGLDEADPLINHENQLLFEMVGARVIRFEFDHIVK